METNNLSEEDLYASGNHEDSGNDLPSLLEAIARLEAEPPAQPVRRYRAHAEDILSLLDPLWELHQTDFFRAQTILREIQSLGAGRAANGEKLKTARVIGDALGCHRGGLGLHSFMVSGKRVYDLGGIYLSEDEKKARIEEARASLKTENPVRIA